MHIFSFLLENKRAIPLKGALSENPQYLILLNNSNSVGLGMFGYYYYNVGSKNYG
jgi:hypothetical protein